MEAIVYFLRCNEGSLYAGATTDLELRLAQHQSGFFPNSFTSKRRPVTLVKAVIFPSMAQALEAEIRIKKWKRSKKEAFISDDEDLFRHESRNSAARRRAERKNK